MAAWHLVVALLLVKMTLQSMSCEVAMLLAYTCRLGVLSAICDRQGKQLSRR